MTDLSTKLAAADRDERGLILWSSHVVAHGPGDVYTTYDDIHLRVADDPSLFLATIVADGQHFDAVPSARLPIGPKASVEAYGDEDLVITPDRDVWSVDLTGLRHRPVEAVADAGGMLDPNAYAALWETHHAHPGARLRVSPGWTAARISRALGVWAESVTGTAHRFAHRK